MTTITCLRCGARFEIDQTPAMPFCSVRCQQMDLQGWLNEEHSLPHVPKDDEELESWLSQQEE
jgi:hypothetical protein